MTTIATAVARPLLILTVLAFAVARADAQFLARPHLDWRTIETTHFRIHYPDAMRAWTETFSERIEPVHGAVAELVGSAPDRRVDVVIDDPYSTANGLAFASITAPAIYVWPTPPEPGGGISEHRGWAELLAVHEFAHIAHLTRPTRNPARRLLWRILPEQIGPIARRAPRWVTEGYATYVEGKLTGSGRPHGVFRPAVLRQFALEGQLPSYQQMSGSRAFLGNSMAYLAGSAYLEWLVEQRGEESLRHLWRRMTARSDRGFVAAFRGVYGDTPEALYRRFTVEITAEALRIAGTLGERGLVEGELVQRREWATGRPALSADGGHIAIALPTRDRPAPVVIWSTGEEPEPERVARQRERMLERDPEDIPAIRVHPRPRRALATLEPAAGRTHDDPRFFADGDRVLVTRAEPLPDGARRPDLFIWHWRTGALSRVTHGAGVRTPDPSPDGREAAGVRCANGICDIVLVDLQSGTLKTLVAGSTTRSFSRPRFAPDARRIVAAVHDGGVWWLAVIDRASGALAPVPGSDNANRYDAGFTADGDSLVAISDAGGISNVVVIAVASGEERPLTRLAGAALAPAPSATDSWVYFLSLHGRGTDLARIRRDTPDAGAAIVLDQGRAAAAPVSPSVPAVQFPTVTVPQGRPYGLGPRHHRLLPSGSANREWQGVGMSLIGTDPVGRLSWMLQGMYSDPGGWRGATLGVEWRRWRPVLGADAFMVRHDPSRAASAPPGIETLDADYTAGVVGVRLEREIGARGERYRAGLSNGRLALDQGGTMRPLAFAELDATLRAGGRYVLDARAGVHGSTGRTLDQGWLRSIASVALVVTRDGDGVALSAAGGRVSRDAPDFERFVLGGVPSPLVDAPLLAQRIPIPALTFAARTGDRFAIARAALAGAGLQPYYLLANAGDLSARWNRVAGIEHDLILDRIPLLRLPAIHALAGVGYSFDEPARRTWRGYVTASFRP
ncbi:MAG TPA: hypothetical protein VMM18_08945 [Gemmatimonadaceae bacterium]|nr:hypothetical protein [Gemmatimonadaceae bacterium]